MSTRDTILTAAATVMREQGILRATTKEIAREAGYSEALLYKHFADKQELFMAVLQERVTGLVNPADLVGTGEVRGNLIDIVRGLMEFYRLSFPMSASLFSDASLLGAWRDGIVEKGGGPRVPLRMLQAYLEAEQQLGRVPAKADVEAIAVALCGAAFQQGVFAAFDGQPKVARSRRLATQLVDAVRLSRRP
ncbi:TetR/AcrR family transcriptional regulator [soil metagenome]